MTSIYHFLSSKRLTLFLFGVLIAVLIPESLIKEKIFFFDAATTTILTLVAINLLLCSVRRYKRISGSVLIIHLGCLITLAGGLISAFGYVATVNIYEGDSAAVFYKWDVEKDVSLGFELAVREIHTSYYPVGVKVGVLRGGEKTGLFIVKTGESFELDGYRIMVHSLDFTFRSLTLQVYGEDNRSIGIYHTQGDNELPTDFPYTFKLVSFQNPALKRIWVDISILKDNKVVVQGVTEVNHPFKWDGMGFYNTQINQDGSGTQYAGIQIVKDPGIPYVYAGFLVICIGALLHLPKCFTKVRR